MLPTDKEVLTTGEVARICNVAPRTVSKWFDNGTLKGYRIPGSKDRRIPVPELLRFMKQHGIPFDGISAGKMRVLVADDEPEVVTALHKLLTEHANYDVRTASSLFLAGIECERFKPHVMLLDVHLLESGHDALAQFVHNDDDLQLTRIIAMSGKLTDAQMQTFRGMGFETVLRKPFTGAQVLSAVEQATSVLH